MIKLFIFGITGKIGKIILKFSKINNNIIILGGINKNNKKKFLKKKYDNFFINIKNCIFIDFSDTSLIKYILNLSKKFKIPLIIGTTGYNLDELKLIKKNSNFFPIIISYNMSIGINILNLIISNTNLYFYRYNFNSFILDIHHNIKKDTPSGTSLMISSKILNNIKISSFRIKNIIGNHIIYFISNYEIIKIEHYVTNRKIFILGIFYCIFWILKKKFGCFSMYDVFFK